MITIIRVFSDSVRAIASDAGKGAAAGEIGSNFNDQPPDVVTGLAGGFIYDQHEKSKEKAYEEGYKAGQQSGK